MIAIGAWESALQDAVHEPDPTMAEAKIRMAEEAIFDRIHDCSISPGSLEEQALFDAAWHNKNTSQRATNAEIGEVRTYNFFPGGPPNPSPAFYDSLLKIARQPP